MDSNSRAFASGWYMEVDVSEDLRSLALAATPGPYSLGGGDKIKGADGKTVARVSLGWRTSAQYKANLMFIAAASPEAIIGLLDRIKELEVALKPFANVANEWGRSHGDAYKFTMGDLRRAQAAISASQSKETEKPAIISDAG